MIKNKLKELFETMQEDAAESHHLSDTYWDSLMEIVEPLLKDEKKEECGFMILTPTPIHNGGMWCAESYPCKQHGEWRKDAGKTVDITYATKLYEEKKEQNN